MKNDITQLVSNTCSLSDCVIQNVMFFLPLDSELLRADALPCVERTGTMNHSILSNFNKSMFNGKDPIRSLKYI